MSRDSPETKRNDLLLLLLLISADLACSKVLRNEGR